MTTVSNTGNVALGTTSSGKVTTKTTDQLNKDLFMKLLVAELKNQNPMQPTDPSSFLQQSAQFSMIEKLDLLTKQGETSSQINQMTTAAAFIGKRVTYTNSNGESVQGTVASVKFPVGAAPTLKVGSAEISLTDVQGVDAGSSA